MYRFKEEAVVDSQNYEKILAERIENINSVIDNHLIYVNGKTKFDVDLKEKDVHDKLEMLFQQQ